jgi:ATP-dependent protease HslVU (ClpYQ) ATPase subunit
MVTTIQLNENVKMQLDQMKESDRQTYEDVIIKMIQEIDEKRRKQRDLLIEQCKVMYDDDLKVTKEWESLDYDVDWEW